MNLQNAMTCNLKRPFKFILSLPSWTIYLLLGLLTISWYSPGKLLVGVDTILPYNLHNFINEYFYVWSNKAPPGLIDINKLSFIFPLGLLLKIIDQFNLSLSVFWFEKILLYTLYSGAGISAYKLSKTIFPKVKEVANISAGILYMFNFYVLFILTPLPLPILFSYCFFPYVFSQFISLVTHPNLRKSLIFSIIWVTLLNTSYGTPPYLIIHISIFIFYAIFHHVFINKNKAIKKFLLVMLSFIIWFLLSSYITIPLILNYNHEINAYINTGGTVSIDAYLANSVNIFEGFRLMGYFGLDDGYLGARYYAWFPAYKTNLFKVLSFLLPIIAFLPLIIKKRSKLNYYFLTFLALVMIFFVKGSNFPLGSINSFIYDKLHLFTLFRSGYQRFTGFIALCLSLMSAYSLDSIINTKALENRKFIRYLPFFLINLILAVVFVFPLWTGSLFIADKNGPSYQVKIPEDYIRTADWLQNQQEDSNILPLPFCIMGISNLKWNGFKDGYSGPNPLAIINQKRFFITGSLESLQSEASRMIAAGNERAIELLKLLNIRYILLQNDANWNYVNNHGWWISADQSTLQNNLENFKWIDSVKKIGNLWFYRVDDSYYLQHFYIPKSIIITQNSSAASIMAAISKKTPQESFAQISSVEDAFFIDEISKYSGIKKETTIASQKINITKYNLKLESVSNPFPLIFSESYDAGWKIYSSKKDLETKTTSVIDFLKKSLDTHHFQANGYANGWLIDPKKICNSQTNMCFNNSDGSYDIFLSIEFEPQRITNFSYMISIITMIITAILLGYIQLRKI